MIVGAKLGRYVLLGKLAQGGMAEVFLAKEEGPEGVTRTVVIKRLLPHLAQDEHFIRMFLNEARLAVLINHPNIVTILELGRDTASGAYFIAMEWIDGCDLKRLMRTSVKGGAFPPPHIIARIIADACGGLEFAHNLKGPDGTALGPIHRDISPENILITYTGLVKVVDFGIAKAPLGDSLTRSGELKGKFPYMAPEIILQVPSVDRRVDIWALGVTMYWLLSGTRPFVGESAAQLVHSILHADPVPLDKTFGVPTPFAAVVAHALRKDPAQRYATARQMQRELELAISTVRGNRPVDVAAYVAGLFPEDRDPDRAAIRAIISGEMRPTGTPSDSDLPLLRRAVEEVTRANTSATTLFGQKLLRWPIVAAALASVSVASFAAERLMRRGQRAEAETPEPSLVPLAPTVAADPPAARSPPEEPPAVAAPEPAKSPAPVDEKLAAPTIDTLAPAPRSGATRLSTPVRAAVEPPKRPAHRTPRASTPSASDLPGTLTFRVVPFAEVYLDGTRLGVTPLDPMSVPPGKHSLRLVNDEIQVERRLTVEVKSGETTPIKAKLQ